MTKLNQQLDDWIGQMSPFGLDKASKRDQLLPLLNALHQHHRAHCVPYANIMTQHPGNMEDFSAIPYLAVRLFKMMSLQSIPENQVFKLLQSSGTSGQKPARVALDKATASRQSRTLVRIMQQVIGRQRLPMLILDSASVLKDRHQYSARGAGIQGLLPFGRDHTYALDNNMQLDKAAIEAFAQRHQGQPVLMFGFTFMAWAYVIKALADEGCSLPFSEGVLIHSGGWKKLQDQQVDDDQFQSLAKATLGVDKVHNFYGMAEQVGSVFVQCQQGHLHVPACSEVIIRDPYTLAPLPAGIPGLIQVMSILPTSYPGFSLLTEDMGQWHGEDDCLCGWKGRYFSVAGRLPKTELRGCSDTHAA